MKTRLTDIDAYFTNLPASRGADEIRRDYAATLARQMRRYDEAMVERGLARPALQVAVDAVVAVCREAAGAFLRVVERIDEVVARLVPQPDFAFAGARAATSPEARKVVLSKKGEDCSLSATLEVAGASTDVSLALFDAEGRQVLPFTLTVEDADAGATLLDGRTFTAGAAALRDVAAGSYRVLAEAGGRRCVLTFRVC